MSGDTAREVAEKVDSVIRRLRHVRPNLVLYYSVLFFGTAFILMTYRVFVPANHLQDRLAIWTGAPQLVLEPKRRKLVSLSRNTTTSEHIFLKLANRLKRELFSEESLRIRARTRRWRNATSRIAPVVQGKRRQKDFAFRDLSLALEERVEDLVSQMTVDEVIQQSIAEYGKATPGIDRLGIRPFFWASECLQIHGFPNSTAFPQPLAIAASFR